MTGGPTSQLHIAPYLALVALGAALSSLSAQGAKRAVVIGRVVDVAGAPLSAVDISVIKNDTEAVVLVRTDGAGRYVFAFQPESASYMLVARKVGYAQTGFTLRVAGDTTPMDLRLARLAPAADTIRATEERLPLEKRPYIGQAEIARDTRAIFTLRDVLGKLRPDIEYQSGKCLGATLVRVVGGMQITRIGALDGVQRAAPKVYVNGRLIPSEFGPMGSIKSEHIDEVRYVNCMDDAIPGLPPKPWPSVYVVLKPGVAWDLKRGSHVVDSVAFTAARTSPPR
jgi:hypothetical protein